MATKKKTAAVEELKITEACKLLGISDMTLYNWRTGRTSNGRTPIPEKLVQVGERHRVTFPKAKLEQWMIKHAVPFDKKVAKALGVLQ